MRLKYAYRWFWLYFTVGIIISGKVCGNLRSLGSWKTGSWSNCASDKPCGKGMQKRDIYCASPRGTIVPDADCVLADKPATVQTCLKVCNQHKPFLRWFTGPWSQCLSSHNSSFSCTTNQLEIGQARRDVFCIFSQEEDKSETILPNYVCEYFWTMPKFAQPCSLECPQDCIIVADNDRSSAAEWEAEFDNPTVLVAPEPGGQPCPTFRNGSPCFNGQQCTISSYEEYVLKVNEWSPCFFMDKSPSPHGDSFSILPVVGQTVRNIACLNKTGEKVNLRFCNMTKIPVSWTQQYCIVASDCQVSPWSEWKIEKEGCRRKDDTISPEIRSRVRFLVKGPVGNGAPCGPLYERRSVVANLPPCEKYKWLPSEWGDCVYYAHYPPNGEVHVIKPTCGGGLQTRNWTCERTSDLVPVDKNLCLETKGSSIQPCTIPCVKDCEVSEWSLWGPCLPINEDEVDVVDDGYRARRRVILNEALHGGHECPHLEEFEFCYDAKSPNIQYGEWSECRPFNINTGCGSGERTRTYTCLNTSDKLKESSCEDIRQKSDIIFIKQKCKIPCPDDCLLSPWSRWTTCHGEKQRTRSRNVLALPGINSSQCSQDELTQDESCEGMCLPMHWEIHPWKSCRPLNGGTCGPGTRHRMVKCNRGNCLEYLNIDCHKSTKPVTKENCTIPCPVDCEVTKFSEWSECAHCSNETQSRERFVIRWNNYDGKTCPHLKETRPCSLGVKSLCNSPHLSKLPLSFAVQWQVSNWSECILLNVTNHCDSGFQIRNVSCTNMDGHPVEMYRCTSTFSSNESNLSFSANILPPHFRLCHISCFNKTRCHLSAWSSWSKCLHHYKSTRVRTRELIGKSANRRLCLVKYKLQEEETCPYLDDRMIPSEHLGSCIIENTNRTIGVNSQMTHFGCGSGYQKKFGLQQEGTDGLKFGIQSNLCVVNCPIDCLMDKWSSWTPCNTTCGEGYRHRNRQVKQPANAYGRPCPKEVFNGTETQIDVCEEPCELFKWQAYAWGNCTLAQRHDPDLECGSGMHHRIVQCVDRRNKNIVDQRFCDPILKPPFEEPCEIYCPGECVVSDWKIQKPCYNPCREADVEVKIRKILRIPSPHHSPCPILKLTEPCLFNKTCFTFSWEQGSWGSCTPPEDAICGEGVQRKALKCVRSDGKQVASKYCEKNESSQPQMHETSRPCNIDCPIDCVVSQWSEWDSSQCRSCEQSRMMTRKRTILQDPSNSGQPCPLELKQKTPCSFKSCYHWNISSWSSCDLKDSECGIGVRRRVVQCVRYDYLHVDNIHCLIANLTFQVNDWLDPKWLTQGHNKVEEEPCYKQCPGDCVLSEWSEWSPCHRRCTEGQIFGYRTSSRFVIAPKSSSIGHCSDNLIRTQPCWDGDCYSYMWKFQNGSFHCERSDGLSVKGGCRYSAMPCDSKCSSVFHGKCDEKIAICYCELPNGTREAVPKVSKDSDYTCERLTSFMAVRDDIRRPINYSVPTQTITLKYYPDDQEVSIWMYAMISVGSAFVIFVMVTVYLMCRSSLHRRVVSVHRQASMRRRELINQEKQTCRNSEAPNKVAV